MKLNKKLEIGLNAVTALKKRGSGNGFVKIVDIANEVGTTVHFLEQIMRDLRVSGIVAVQRGRGGGYLLNYDPDLTAYSVAKAVGRFPDVVIESVDHSVPTILKQNILEAFRNTKI